MTLRGPMLLLASALAACGVDGPPTAGEPGSSGGKTDDASDSGAGADAGGGDAAAGDGGGDPDTRLYPLAVGRVWTYQIASTYPSCPSGTREARVLETGEIEDRSTFRMTGSCGAPAEVAVDGDVVDVWYDWGPTGWYRMLDEPVADGHTWTTTNGSGVFTQTYSALGEFGGHDDCWRVDQNVPYTSYWIYCRGVGMVWSELIDLAGGTIRHELVQVDR